MKFGKRAFVYVVLFIVFIAQIAFSGNFKAQAATSDTAVAGYDMAKMQEEALNVSGFIAMPAASPETETEEENVVLELNVVYADALSSSSEIIDELSADVPSGCFKDKVISYCESRITVYSEPDTSSEAVGCMYSRTQADIIEKGEEWTKISSGNVEGYVKNVYLLFGEEAEKVAPFLGKKTTIVGDNDINVYAAADAGSAVVDTFYAGQNINAYDENNGWVLVECTTGFGYVREEGVISSYDLGTGMTIEEENEYLAELARIEAERIAAEREAAAKIAAAQAVNVGITQNESMSVSAEDQYLLACIIEWEAGWEPYEGKLAVANVVLNRVRSPRFVPKTIPDVIYSPGQFTGVLGADGQISERFAALLASGPSHDDCYTAAAEALAGVNNIDDYLFFISVKKANYARYTKWTVINNHCFYAY